MKSKWFLVLGIALLMFAPDRASATVSSTVTYWRLRISDELPKGSNVGRAKAFFSGLGVDSRFSPPKHILDASYNIEPEPRSLLPLPVMKSVEIFCQFDTNDRLTDCRVEGSFERVKWERHEMK